jgi:hypothetical protein
MMEGASLPSKLVNHLIMIRKDIYPNVDIINANSGIKLKKKLTNYF